MKIWERNKRVKDSRKILRINIWFRTMIMDMFISCEVKTSSLVDIYKCFDGICYLHLQDRRIFFYSENGENSLLRNIIENFLILKFETKGTFEDLKTSCQIRRRPMPQKTIFEFFSPPSTFQFVRGHSAIVFDGHY